jgi:diguanylate cyclase (GGDEF)-like protein
MQLNTKTEDRPVEDAVAECSESDEKEKLFRLIFDSNIDAIFVADEYGSVKLLNRKAEQFIGLPAEKILGRTLKFLRNPRASHEIRVSRKGEEAIIAELRSLKAKMPDSQLLYISTLRDITELVRLREEMSGLNFMDDLVGLCNRRGFFVLAQQQLKLAERTRQGVYLLLLRLDNYDHINTVNGEQAGKKLLVRFAAVLKNTFRASDIMARISDNVFAVIAIGAKPDSTDSMAGHLSKNLEFYNEKIVDDDSRLLASMGTAYYFPEQQCSLDQLFGQADSQLYVNDIGNRKSALLWCLMREKACTM